MSYIRVRECRELSCWQWRSHEF